MGSATLASGILDFQNVLVDFFFHRVSYVNMGIPVDIFPITASAVTVNYILYFIVWE